jgi:hypothetical protein
MNQDTSHLQALITMLGHERERLAKARKPGEIALRKVWVWQCEKEVAGELRFLGMDAAPIPEMSDDDLLVELGA